MNICINTSSISQLASGEKIGFEQALVKCVEKGVRNVELDEQDSSSREQVLQLFNDIRNNGGNVAVLNLGLNLLGGDVKSNEKYLNNVKSWIKFCSENGCRVLRLKATPVGRETYSENDFKLLYRNLLNILSSAEKNSVEISVSTDKAVYSNMDRLAAMIEDIGSETIGITLNSESLSKLDEKMLEKLVPLVNHVTVSETFLKSVKKSVLEKVFKTLKTIAYGGYVSLQLNEACSMEELSNYVDTIRRMVNP
ncbi:MAG: TIM barrel protein [Thermoproteota archaeon]